MTLSLSWLSSYSNVCDIHDALTRMASWWWCLLWYHTWCFPMVIWYDILCLWLQSWWCLSSCDTYGMWVRWHIWYDILCHVIWYDILCLWLQSCLWSWSWWSPRSWSWGCLSSCDTSSWSCLCLYHKSSIPINHSGLLLGEMQRSTGGGGREDVQPGRQNRPQEERERDCAWREGMRVCVCVFERERANYLWGWGSVSTWKRASATARERVCVCVSMWECVCMSMCVWVHVCVREYV